MLKLSFLAVINVLALKCSRSSVHPLVVKGSILTQHQKPSFLNEFALKFESLVKYLKNKNRTKINKQTNKQTNAEKK